MAQSVFKNLSDMAIKANVSRNTRQSRSWFQNEIKRMGSISRTQLLKDPALKKRSQIGVGKMYFYFYDPKHKDTLPFYDAFPLVVAVGPAKGGFYGLNLHYLSPFQRAKFLDKLMEITNNKRFDETTKIRLSYEFLSSAAKYKAFAPCFKRYLYSHVQSSVTMVEAKDWEIATFLDTQQFRKQNARAVWANSRKAI